MEARCPLPFCFSSVRSRFSRRSSCPPPSRSTPPSTAWRRRIPKDWPIAVHEEDDRIFVAIIPQADFDRPGIAACELALAPESLDDYRTRIDTSAKKNGRKSGKLASNQVIKDARGERLETIWEFHPDAGGFWHEVSVRIIANRQLYTFILNVEDAIYAKTRPAFDALVIAAKFSAPNTGADLLAKKYEPVDSARVSVCTRPSRRMAAGAGPEPGRAALRQRAAHGHLVRQSPGARASARNDRPGRARQAPSRPAQARGSELPDHLVQDHCPGQSRRRSRPSCAPTGARSR